MTRLGSGDRNAPTGSPISASTHAVPLFREHVLRDEGVPVTMCVPDPGHHVPKVMEMLVTPRKTTPQSLFRLAPQGVTLTISRVNQRAHA